MNADDVIPADSIASARGLGLDVRVHHGGHGLTDEALAALLATW